MTDKYDQLLDAPDKYDAFLDAPEPSAQPSVAAPAVVPQVPEAPKKRSIAEELARQMGLTVRGGVAGVLSPLTMASDALVALYNKGTDSNVQPTSQAVQGLMTQFGLPTPENRVERAVQAGVEGMAGQAGLTKAAQVAGATASPLLNNVTQQVVSAGAAGTAAQPTAEYVLQTTGSPMAAVAAALAVGSLAGKVAGNAAGAKPNKTITIDDIKQRAQRSYNAMEQMDVKAKPLSVQNMISKTEQSLASANFNPQLDAHRPVAQLLEQFRQMVGDQRVPFTKLEQMRSAAVSMSRESNDAGTRRLAGIVVGNIDDYLGNLTSRDLMPGSQRGEDAVKAVVAARNDWKLQARAQTIEDLLDTASLRAEDPKASEADLIRRGLTNLAANKNKMRQFSTDEQAAIRQAVKAKGYDPILTLLAKFNPERGGLGAGILSGGVGGSMYTGSLVPSAGAAGLTSAGYLADKLYGTIKQREAANLVSSVLSGNPQVKPSMTTSGLFGAMQANPNR